MKRLIVAAALSCSMLDAFAAMAVWTGRSELVTTVTGRQAWRCEYDYAGQRFWRLFETMCPASIDVY